jgi:hypothetical protein
MQNHRTRKARKARNLGSSREAWILTSSSHASLPVSKCIHLDNGQRTHRGYSRILCPQLSNATVIIHRPVTNGSQRHDGRLPESSSRRPIRQRRDDTIQALTDLAATFKLKLQQAPSPAGQAGPAKGVPHSSLIPSSTQILNSPTPDMRQTRSETTIHTQNIPNVPLTLRVVTPLTLRPSPPRVTTGSQRLSPRNLSQDDFCGMESAHMAIALGYNHWSQQHHANAVIHPVTGKEMEYSALMKDPRLQPLWT